MLLIVLLTGLINIIINTENVYSPFILLQTRTLIFHFSASKVNCGNINALDEGSFLWAQRGTDNAVILRKDKESVVKPSRWTRSVFNWLHSPLINSIQEAFVADSIYDNSPPSTKYVKRSLVKNTSSTDLEESFENEFFLWEDDEGNPLEFGLKQIEDKKPYEYNQTIPEQRRFNRARADGTLWEEPLVYEYNQDAKDVDINHLSFHEKFKLNDILKNKFHKVFNHSFTFKHGTTKHPSMYYTLEHPKNISSTVNCSNGTCSTKNFWKQTHLKNTYKDSLTSTDIIVNAQNAPTEISIGDAFRKQSFYYVISSDSGENNFTELTTLKSSTSLNPSSTDTDNFISQSPKDAMARLKPWLDFHEARLDGEETASILNDNFNKHGPIKSFDAQQKVSNETSIHRKLKTTHRKRFLKYRRKNKRKNNKSKYPEGHSSQFELFNGNSKSSIK